MAFKYKLKEAPTPNLAQQTGAKKAEREIKG